MPFLRRGDGKEKTGGRISFDEFCTALKINGYPEPFKETFDSFLNEARNFSIFDKQELAMVLAHFISDSEGFVERREKVDLENYPEDYKDPSCDAPGQLYYQRGYLKIAHCKNYRDASYDIYKDDRLVQDPTPVVIDEEVAFKVGFSHWKRNVHPLPAVKEGQFGVTTNALKGSSECSGSNVDRAKSRFKIYQNVRKAFGLDDVGPEAERGCYDLSEFMKISSQKFPTKSSVS